MVSGSVVAIATALIAGAFTFAGLVLGKENKTSEFRQAWIDSLRQEVSDFVGYTSHILSYWLYIRDTSSTEELFQRRSSDFLKQSDQILCTVVALEARIRLRLNPAEHAHFIKQLARVYELASADALPASHKVVRAELDELIQQSQKLLKCEWVRVKQGEPVFWITRAIALGVVAGVTVIGLSLYTHWNYVVNG